MIVKLRPGLGKMVEKSLSLQNKLTIGKLHHQMRRRFARLLFAAVACFMATVDVAAYDGGKVFYQFNASNGLADNSAQTIMCTKTGRMVISTIGHINFYDGDRFTHIDPTTGNVFPLPKYNGHYRMMFDRHHHLWLKDKLVVSCVDLGTESFIDDVGEAACRRLVWRH